MSDIPVDKMTPDEARARLVRDGANMTPDVKERMTLIAAGMDAPTGRRPMTISPFGTTTVAPLTAEEAAQMDPDGATVLMIFPRPVRLQLQDRRKVHFDVGTQPVPRFLADHSYLAANGVTRSKGQGAAPRKQRAKIVKPRQVEAGKKLPTPEEVRKLAAQHAA